MGICREIRTYSSHHEWVGNIFSLLAVALIFGTVLTNLWYYEDISAWIRQDIVFHGAMVGIAVAMDLLLVLILLSIGSARAGEEHESCFATFRGRRGGGNPIDAFRNWVQHMENVGKKHR